MHPAKAQTTLASTYEKSSASKRTNTTKCHAVSHNTKAIAIVSKHRIREGLTSAEVAIDIRKQLGEKSASP